MNHTGLRLAAGLIALGIAGVGQLGVWLHVHRSWATLLLVAGCFLAALALGAPKEHSVALRNASDAKPKPRRPVVGWILGGIGAALFVIATWELFFHWQKSFDWAAPLLVGATILTSVGLAFLDRPWRTPASYQHWQPTRWEILAVTALFALAGFLRFYKITSFPPTDGFCAIEEPQSGQGAWQILAQGARPWEFLIDRWLPVPLFHWFGIDLVNLRIPFAAVSWLTVVVTYFLCRQLLSFPAALGGAFLLAVSHWHLLYARLAHNIFPSTLFSVMGWLLCVRQATTGGFRLYPIIGLWCGYSLYVYAGYRATPLLVAVFFLPLIARNFLPQRQLPENSLAQRRNELPAQLLGVGLILFFFSGPVIALVGQLWHQPLYFFEAFIRSYNNKAYYTADWPSWFAVRWQRLKDTAAIFHHHGDIEAAYNLPGEPMLDPISGIFVTAGLFYCIIHWRHRFQWFFAFAFLFTVLAGTLLTQSLSVNRLPAAVPLAFVLAAFLFDRLVQLASTGGRGRKLILVVTAAAAGIFTFSYNYQTYFHRTVNNRQIREVYRNWYTTAIVYLHSLPDSAYLNLVSDMHNFFAPSDYEWWRGDRVPGKVTTDLLPLLTGELRHAQPRDLYVLIQHPFEQAELGELLRQFVPGVTCEWVRHPDYLPHLDQLACAVPSGGGRTAVKTTLHATYALGDANTPFLERWEPALSWGLVPDQCGEWGGSSDARCVAEWDGTFTLPSNESGYELALEGRNVTLSGQIAGETVIVRPSTPVVGHLTFGQFVSQRFRVGPGKHALRLRAEYQDRVNLGVRLLYRSGTSEWRLVHFAMSGEG